MELPAAAIQEVVDVVGPTASAVAALCALLAVWQAGKLSRDATLPDLSVELTIDPIRLALGATIHNAGTGVARNSYVVYVVGGQQATAYVPTGVIRPNERFSVTTEMLGPVDLIGKPSGDAAALMVTCRDREGRFHAWTHDGREKIWRPGKVEDGVLSDRFQDMFPEVSLNGLTAVEAKVTGPL